MSELEAFAAHRTKDQAGTLPSLVSAAKKALARYGKNEWDAPILDVAEGIFRRAFREITGTNKNDDLAKAVSDYRESLSKALNPKGFTPDDNSASLIGRWVNVSAWSAGADFGGKVEGLQMQWVTMHDDKVRTSHHNTDGQKRRHGQKFMVGPDAKGDFATMRRPGDTAAPMSFWIGCRCTLMPVRGKTAALVSAQEDNMAFTVQDIEMHQTEEDTEPVPTSDDAFQAGPIPWYGPLTVEGRMSGDRRKFTQGGLTWRDFPLPLSWQKQSMPGHDGSVVVARIDGIYRDEETGLINGYGVFDTHEDAGEAMRQAAEGFLSGVSVDVDMVQAAEMSDKDGDFYEFSGRIAGATLCAIPAFAEAKITLGIDPNMPDEAMLAAATEAEAEFKRGPGWVTDPEDTRRIHNYWTKPGQPGYAKINWGVPGDFNRCRTHLSKYIRPDLLNQVCAQWHHDALGIWPGQEGRKSKAAALEECTDCEETTMPIAASGDQEVAPMFNLVAGAATVTHRADFFENPNLIMASPGVVTNEGRCFGHLATWNTCHIGFSDRCVQAPKSMTDYSYFHLGSVLTEKGEIPVGHISLGGGHASMDKGFRAAVEHYDSTSAVVADVVVGEDEFGIWYSGQLRPGVTDEQIAELRSAPLSGDWRKIGSGMELVAALAVNTPGFMIPRPQVLLASGSEQELALVAAGVVQPLSTTQAITAAAIVDEMERRQAVRAMEAIKAQVARDMLAQLKSASV